MSKSLDITSSMASKPGVSSVVVGPELARQEGVAKCSGISLYEARGKFGFQNYKIQVTVNGRTHILDTCEVAESDRGWNLLSSPEPGLEVNLRLMPLDRSHQYVLKVSLKNTLERDLRLEAAAFGQFGCDARFLPGESHILAWGLRTQEIFARRGIPSAPPIAHTPVTCPSKRGCWATPRTRWKKNFVTQELDPRSARLFELR